MVTHPSPHHLDLLTLGHREGGKVAYCSRSKGHSRPGPNSPYCFHKTARLWNCSHSVDKTIMLQYYPHSRVLITLLHIFNYYTQLILANNTIFLSKDISSLRNFYLSTSYFFYKEPNDAFFLT